MSEEVEKIMDLAGDCETEFSDYFNNSIPSDAIDNARQKLRKAVEALVALSVTNIMLDVVPGEDGMGHEVFAKSVDDVTHKLSEMGERLEALVQERDDWKRAIMERRNSIAKVLDEKANERREREADRKRFPDPAFNEWLDEGISDAGHTVWDATENIADAWAGWQNREYYGKSQVQPQERECECCNDTGVINERLGGEWNSNPAVKCPDCDGAGVWEAKAQVRQEPQYKSMFESAVGALAEIDRILGIEDDGCNSPQQTISVLKERLQDTQEPQEPVGLVEPIGGGQTNGLMFRNLPVGTKLYAAPVTQVQQEPVGSVFVRKCWGGKGTTDIEIDYWGDLPDGSHQLYAAPVSQEPTCKQDLQVEAQVQQEALFLLHTGKFYDGGQDEWEIEADSYNTVSAFCHAHPEQTIGLYAAPVNDTLREAVQKALELARDGAIESLVEALEAVK